MANSDINRLIDMLYERIEDAKSPALKPNMSIVDLLFNMGPESIIILNANQSQPK